MSIDLANAHLRYLPRAAHFAEAFADVRYETVMAGLEPNGVEIVLDAVSRPQTVLQPIAHTVGDTRAPIGIFSR